MRENLIIVMAFGKNFILSILLSNKYSQWKLSLIELNDNTNHASIAVIDNLL